MKRLFSILPLLSLLSCSHPAAAPVKSPRAAASPRHGGIAWIDDDYPKALALARETKRPLVIDYWAVWCHFCTTAEGFTFKDPSIVALGPRFVWSRVNVDDPKNGDLLAKIKLQGLPTYLVLDPANESIAGRWLGSGTPSQFALVLRDADAAYGAAHANGFAWTDPLRWFIDANVASHSGDHAGAAASFEKAISVAPKDWDRLPDALAALSDEYAALGKFSDSIRLALLLPESSRGSGAANLLDTAMGVLDRVPVEKSAEWGPRLEARAAALANDPGAPLAADERSNLWADIAELRKARGDAKGARQALERELSVLDDAAKGAPDAASASGFSSYRAQLMVELGRGVDAIAMLLLTQKDLPAMADPPARLAQVYLKLGRMYDALTAIDRAIALAPKGYAAKLLSTRAKILLQTRGATEFCDALQKVLDAEAALPSSERSDSLIADTTQKLEACRKSPPPVPTPAVDVSQTRGTP